MADTPLINGRRFSHTSLEISVQKPDGSSEIFIDIDSIEYSEELEIAFAQGTAIAPIGWTSGTYVPGDCTISMGKSSFQKGIVEGIGDGWLGSNVTIVVKYADEGEDPIADELHCRITGESTSSSYGPDPIKSSVKLKPIKIKRNGIVPIAGMK